MVKSGLESDESDHKYCPWCNTYKPHHEFDRKFENCIDCMKKSTDIHAMPMTVKESVDTLADSLTNRGAGKPTVNDVLREIYIAFGGAKGFAARIHSVVESQLARGKNIPYQTAMILTNLMRIHMGTEANEEKKRVNSMSDEQIRREQQIAIAQMVLEQAADPTKRHVLSGLLAPLGLQLSEVPIGETPGFDLPEVTIEEETKVSLEIAELTRHEKVKRALEESFLKSKEGTPPDEP